MSIRKSASSKILNRMIEDEDDDSVIREGHRLLSHGAMLSMPNIHSKVRISQICKYNSLYNPYNSTN
jgi:HPt (histidine-containing phosphotransfer) domain-containing protein